MSRWFLCIPFLLFFALIYPRPSEEVKIDDAKRGAGGLPFNDPVVFVEKCLEKHRREIRGYKVTLTKRERVKGVLKKQEIIRAQYNVKPHSVHMKWKKGGGIASEVLYVAGQNNNRLLAKVAFGLIITKSLDDSMVKNSGRISIDQFGMEKGMERVLKAWKLARTAGTLKVKYEGDFTVPQLGKRKCYKLHRTGYLIPEKQNEADSIFYIDVKTWQQIGSVLRDKDGKLIGEYYFTDIELNPKYPPGYFGRKLLSR